MPLSNKLFKQKKKCIAQINHIWHPYSSQPFTETSLGMQFWKQLQVYFTEPFHIFLQLQSSPLPFLVLF